MSTKRALTGIRPSGDLHIGNYLGTIKPALAFQSSYECFFFIADMHALTTVREPGALKRLTYDITASWIALGLDTKKHLLYRQSDIPLVTELSWYLSCATGMGLLEKGHAYKDASSGGKDISHGVFAYPVLMAADILLYDADLVPVGKDQKQHVEMARDMAGSFNAAFKCSALKLPEPFIREEVMTIPGLDGRKMSKSYDNVIPVFGEPKAIRKKVLSLKTDSTPLEAPKSLKETVLGELFALFASKDEYADLEKRLNAGGLGWGHAKEEFAEILERYFGEARARYNELRADEQALDRELQHGAERARAIAEPVMQRVRQSVGL